MVGYGRRGYGKASCQAVEDGDRRQIGVEEDSAPGTTSVWTY